MANNEMMNRIEELIAYEQMIEELKAEAEEIRNSIKAEMNARDVEELTIGPHIVRFTSVLTSRFDTKRFKENFGESVYKAYCKEVPSKRFSIV